MLGKKNKYTNLMLGCYKAFHEFVQAKILVWF